jgi:peptidoglycan-associated lipoprotein
MSIRMLPALRAGLMLAACADSGARHLAPPPALSSGALTPGETEVEYGNVRDKVYFSTDSALLQPDAQQMLQKQAAWLQDFPRHTVTIEGHADERGTREYNLALGERRAQAVMDYLIALGIDSKRLKTISYGKERPACTDANEACRSQNRRSVSTLDN